MHGGLNPAPNLAHCIVLVNSLGVISNCANPLEGHVHVKEIPYFGLCYSSSDEEIKTYIIEPRMQPPPLESEDDGQEHGAFSYSQ